MLGPVGTVVIVIVAVFFAGMGAYALAAPAAMLRPFGFDVDNAVARSEVRAVYGGFGLAIAGVLGYASTTSGSLRSGIVLTVAVALAGMAFGRLVSALIEGRIAFYPNWFYFLVEAIAATALLVS